MNILAGPALSFQGIDAASGNWRVSVLFAVQGNGVPEVSVIDAGGVTHLGGPATLHKREGQISVLRYDISVPLGERTVTYAVGSARYTFAVPAAGAGPRMAYGSCNGFSSERLRESYAADGDDDDAVDDNKPLADANWLILQEKHEDCAYHLLVLGGDQVYADEIRCKLKDLRKKMGWSRSALYQQDGPEVQDLLDDFYWNLYLERWQAGAPRTSFAQIPSVTMWDDHDIIDGWGSLDGIENTKLYQAMFAAANKYFLLFQRHRGPDTARPPEYLTAGGHTLGFQVGTFGLLVLDLRSERSGESIMSSESWTSALRWIDQRKGVSEPDGLAHLFVVSSIPVMHPGFQALQNALGMIPGQQEAEDDLRDHWTAAEHEDERIRLIKRLFGFADRTGTCVTIVSGDVHVAAHGLIEHTRHATRRNQDLIHQLTASGIVHPPPHGTLMFGLNRLLEDQEDNDIFIKARKLKFKGAESRFIGARNWLSIEPNGPKAPNPHDVYVKWYVEDVDKPFQLVIAGSTA